MCVWCVRVIVFVYVGMSWTDAEILGVCLVSCLSGVSEGMLSFGLIEFKWLFRMGW